jgi:hypothetical protein
MARTRARVARSSSVNAPPSAAAPSLRRRPVGRGLVRAIVLLAVLGAAELALRAASFSPSVVPQRIVLLGDDPDRALEREDGLLRFDAHTLWALRPGATIPWAPHERVSARGLRGPEPPLAPVPGRLRVAVLGGSAACGVGVAFDETFVGRLPAELAPLGVQADVVCAGVPQASILQTLAHWRATVAAFRPDVVVYAASRGIGWEPAVDRITDAQKILLLERSPGRWRRPRIEGGLRVLAVWPWLVAVADGSWWRERYAAMEARRSELVGEDSESSVRRVSLADLLRCLNALADETAAAGARLVVLAIPRDPDGPDARSSAALVYQAELLDWVRAEDVALLNGRETYATALRELGLERQQLFLAGDLPSPLAHAALARALALEVRKGLDAAR